MTIERPNMTSYLTSLVMLSLINYEISANKIKYKNLENQGQGQGQGQRGEKRDLQFAFRKIK